MAKEGEMQPFNISSIANSFRGKTKMKSIWSLSRKKIENKTCKTKSMHPIRQNWVEPNVASPLNVTEKMSGYCEPVDLY